MPYKQTRKRADPFNIENRDFKTRATILTTKRIIRAMKETGCKGRPAFLDMAIEGTLKRLGI